MSGKWTKAVEDKIAFLQEEISELCVIASKSGGGEKASRHLCHSHYVELRKLYEQELPFARVMDSSNILFRLIGEGVSLCNVDSDIVKGLIPKVKDSLTFIGKVIRDSFVFPKELDPVLGLAPGSLCVGFAFPESENCNPDVDVLRQTIIESVDLLSDACVISNYDQFKGDFIPFTKDPKMAKAFSLSVLKLSPDGSDKIESIMVYGKSIRKPAKLTKDIRSLIASTKEVKEKVKSVVIRGELREHDMDKCSFIIRNIDPIVSKIAEVKCKYSKDVFGDYFLNREGNKITVNGNIDGRNSKDNPSSIIVVKAVFDNTSGFVQDELFKR